MRYVIITVLIVGKQYNYGDRFRASAMSKKNCVLRNSALINVILLFKRNINLVFIIIVGIVIFTVNIIITVVVNYNIIIATGWKLLRGARKIVLTEGAPS